MQKITLEQYKERIKELPVEQVKPYWRNPRTIPQEAINEVSKSIDKYGYNQFIVVDKKNVIIAGHTRYFAFKKLGEKTIAVYQVDLPEKEARAYRLADNKTSQLSGWDLEKLSFEMREIADEDEFVKKLFEDIKFDDLNVNIKDYKTSKADLSIEDSIDKSFEVICPECGHKFRME